MPRYSVFLTPSGADFDYTANLIRELCGKYDVPPFEPHVTLFSGTFSDPDSLKEKLSAAVAGVPPFSLRIRRVGCGEEYFRSLYLEFDENPLLRSIHERLKAGTGIESGHELFPHLSLLYSDMKLRDKEALAKRVVPDRPEIRFDEAKIVTPRNLVEGWRDTEQWQTLFRVRLGTAGRRGPIRAVIFDYGGVLAEEGFREGLFAMARSRGLDPEEVLRTAMDAIYECGYILGRGSEADFWELMRERCGIRRDVDALSGEILRRFVMRPRIMEEVRKLRAKGYITAILSDQTNWLTRLDRRDRFFHEFDRVFNSYELGKGKRDPGIFDDVVAALGVAPGEALFIDDMPANVQRAESRGLATILFKGEEEVLQQLERLP